MIPSLDMLSRLKGIETWMYSIMSSLIFSTLDMLSRLKGIETYAEWSVWMLLSHFFGYAFPFEGNWNRLLFHPAANVSAALDMLSRLKGIETLQPLQLLQVWWELWICFPVWRELKPRLILTVTFSAPSSFGYAFPFEGNWNSWKAAGCHHCDEQKKTLDMLSRLKGIETSGCSRKSHWS